MKVRFKTMLLLLVLQALAGATMLGQAGNRPFVRKFEAGYPNYSYFTSIWPTQTGWWGLLTKFDSLGPGAYYYGAEAVVIDSTFEITDRVSHGDTLRYYLEYPSSSRKSLPDGKGNFWYWLPVYTRTDTMRHLVYGKMDALGHILFEKEIPNTHEADYFFEFLSLPEGRGVFVNTHRGSFTYVTWLNWVDSLGNITHFDSTQRLGSNYFHGTAYCTYDSIRNLILAPSQDYYFSGFQIYNMRPRISVYAPSGSLLLRKDLTAQLQDNSIGTLYNTTDGGYVASLMEFIYDTTAVYEDHRPGIVKFDSNFDVVWRKYLFPRKLENEAYLFHQSPKGDFYYAGRHDGYPTDSLRMREWFITKFSPNLDSLWTRFYNIGGDSIHGILQDPIQIHTLDNGDILVLVHNSGFWPPLGHSINYTTLYKLDSLGCLIGGCAIGDTVTIPPDTVWWQKPPLDPPLTGLGGELLAYPNPSANGVFNLVWDVLPGDRGYLRITDVAGRVLHEQEIWRENRASRLDLRDWAAGTYLVQITSERGRVFRTKLCIVN